MVRVVIVDDDKDTVNVFSQYLKIKKIDVVGEGYNGKDAVELYRDLKPDVIIIDMKMPEYDGTFAIKNIKSEFPDANIIVVSGYPKEYNIDRNDVRFIFVKPYQINDIILAILDCALKVHTSKK